MMSVRKSYLSVAVHDEGWFHAVLSHYASCYNAMHRLEDSETLEHKMSAMNIINKRMGNPAEALRNETIGAVASLAVFEVSRLFPFEI
jgi:hypothetical protein